MSDQLCTNCVNAVVRIPVKSNGDLDLTTSNKTVSCRAGEWYSPSMKDYKTYRYKTFKNGSKTLQELFRTCASFEEEQETLNNKVLILYTVKK